MHIEVSCRAIIYKDPYLLVSNQGGIHCLPWWRLDPGESIEECLRRELIEELNFQASNLTLVAIHEFLKWEKNRFDFIYLVDNPEDFDMEKSKNAVDAHEYTEMKRIDIFDTNTVILPSQIIDRIKIGKFDKIYKFTNDYNA